MTVPSGRTDILGVGFDSVTAGEAASLAQRLITDRAGAYICTPNPEIVMMCRRDPELREAVDGSDLVLPDGVGVLWASRMLGRPLPERVTGIDLFAALLQNTQAGVYLLGGKPGVAEAAAEQLLRDHPHITIAGTAHGYYSDEEAAAGAVRACAPDITAVCLGSPKQELFMSRFRSADTGVMIGLGGALDVLAGRVKRAPESWQERGFEWLWRLMHQPGRAARQIQLPAFAAAVCVQRMQMSWKKEN